MPAQLNLQRNTKVFMSTVDLANGAAVGLVFPANTWQVEILAGYALAQAAATQDITTLESGLTPDRSQQRFLTAINPVDWNFQTYLKPTGAIQVTGASTTNQHATGNALPVADWFLWQGMMSNTAFASQANLRSTWQNGGNFSLASRNASANVSLQNPNFATAVEYHLYFKMDNVVYQVSNATVNQATIDASVDGIATTTWTGFGTNLIELTGVPRNNAISVFGGILNSGATSTANANIGNMSNVASYHPWNSYNVAAAATAASFIKNRLSSITINHANSASAAAISFTFPVTALSFDYNNNITYLSPEEISGLNTPIGQFAGTRAISGSLSAYLRAGDGESSTFLRNILVDSRTSSSATANANLRIGGSTAPYFAVFMPAVQFDIPVHAVDDVIGVSVNFLAQELAKGTGDEITLFAVK